MQDHPTQPDEGQSPYLTVIQELLAALKSDEADQKVVELLTHRREYLDTRLFRLLAKFARQAQQVGQEQNVQLFMQALAQAKGFRLNMGLEQLPEGEEAAPYHTAVAALEATTSPEELQAALQAHVLVVDDTLAGLLLGRGLHYHQKGDEQRATFLAQLSDLILAIVDGAVGEENEDEEDQDNDLDPAPYLELLRNLQQIGGNIRVSWRQILLENLALLNPNLLRVAAALVAGWQDEEDKAIAEQGAGFLVNLAVIISELPRGNRRVMQELVIGLDRLILEVYTLAAYPEQYASTQNNLGNAYKNRIEGERRANLELAIQAYEAALEVMEGLIETTADAQARRNRTKEFFNTSRSYVAVLLAAGRYRQAFRQMEASKGRDLRELLSIGAAQSARSVAGMPTGLMAHYQELNLQLAGARQVLRLIGTSQIEQAAQNFPARFAGLNLNNRENLLAHFKKVVNNTERELQNFLQNEVTAHSPALAETLARKLVSPTELGPYLAKDEALVEFFCLPATSQSDGSPLNPGLVALIIRPQDSNLPELPAESYYCAPQQAFGVRELEQLEAKWFNSYYAWIGALQDEKASKEQQEAAFQQWQAAQAEVLAQLAERFFKGLHQHLQKLGVKKLVLVPHQALHFFPLHALPLTKTKRWLDYYGAIRYAPSSTVWHSSAVRYQQHFVAAPVPRHANIMAVVAGSNLPFNRAEVSTIKTMFQSGDLLTESPTTYQNLLTKAAGQAYRAFHFGSHGSFNPGNVNLSRLQIYNSAMVEAEVPIQVGAGKVAETIRLMTHNKQNNHEEHSLSLLDLLEGQLILSATELVTMSACETGIVDWDNQTDDCLSLSSGFLFAGACGVLSSLWSVSDAATALLLIRFYRLWLEEGKNKAEALLAAQKWLRIADASELAQEIRALVGVAANGLDANAYKVKAKDLEEKAKNNSEPPFAHPFYWAGFYLTGF